MKIVVILIALMGFALSAHAKTQIYPEPELSGPRGVCYETAACEAEDHAAMLLPLEMCGQVLKRSGEAKGSWKQLGGKVCVSIDSRNIQN